MLEGEERHWHGGGDAWAQSEAEVRLALVGVLLWASSLVFAVIGGLYPE